MSESYEQVTNDDDLEAAEPGSASAEMPFFSAQRVSAVPVAEEVSADRKASAEVCACFNCFLTVLRDLAASSASPSPSPSPDLR